MECFCVPCGDDMICVVSDVPPKEERGLSEKKLGVYIRFLSILASRTGWLHY